VNDYTRFIEAAPLISQIESTTSSGDLNYQGTAMEVSTTDGDELFHVVVDGNGQIQFLFFRSEGNYRLPLDVMQRVIDSARQCVRVSE
jgi:hypothetical protein